MMSKVPEKAEDEVKALARVGKKKGFVTWEEVNAVVGEDAASPDRMDEVLQTLDEMGIDVLDESEAPEAESDAAEEKTTRTGPAASEEEEGPFNGAAATEKIDDPVRMYLTQMGEIPLLTRDQEISLARTIELT